LLGYDACDVGGLIDPSKLVLMHDAFVPAAFVPKIISFF